MMGDAALCLYCTFLRSMGNGACCLAPGLLACPQNLETLHPDGLSCCASADQLKACPGSSHHQMWQAVRASSAAPYYLDDFKCGHDRQALHCITNPKPQNS